MKYVIFIVSGIALVVFVLKTMKIIVSDIKRDPVANLIIPVITALITSLLLILLEM